MEVWPYLSVWRAYGGFKSKLERDDWLEEAWGEVVIWDVCFCEPFPSGIDQAKYQVDI